MDEELAQHHSLSVYTVALERKVEHIFLLCSIERKNKSPENQIIVSDIGGGHMRRH